MLFSVKFSKFLKASCFKEYLVAASEGFRFPACIFRRRRLWKRCFVVNFAKFIRKFFSFDTTPPDDCFLRLSVNFEMFFRTLLLQSTSGKLLFYVRVVEFQLTDTVKNYFTGAFQAIYTRSRCSHSKELIYLKIQKTVCEEGNLL